MAADRVERRMAATWSATVGSWARMRKGTLATLKIFRDVIDGLIAHHQGRIFGSAGDSIIAEFASAVEAVRCATEIQLEIDRRNADLPQPNRMRFRIGINLGDIIVDGGSLTGDGVNVAVRLEACRRPAEYASPKPSTRRFVTACPSISWTLTSTRVKNIMRSVRAYRVPLASEEQIKSPFRGLDAFDFEHAHLFFGRSHAIATCIERLEQLAASGKAFLLI